MYGSSVVNKERNLRLEILVNHKKRIIKQENIRRPEIKMPKTDTMELPPRFRETDDDIIFECNTTESKENQNIIANVQPQNSAKTSPRKNIEDENYSQKVGFSEIPPQNCEDIFVCRETDDDIIFKHDTTNSKENQNRIANVQPEDSANENNEDKNYSQKMGFFEEQFEYLQHLVKKGNKGENRQNPCSLIIYETTMLPKIEKVLGHTYGQVTLYDVNATKQDMMASKAICLMAISLKEEENWKVPLSLSFINNLLPPKTFAIVIKYCLFKLNIIGVQPVSITFFDVNFLGFALAKELGAHITQPFFKNVYDGNSLVNIMFDLPTLIKQTKKFLKNTKSVRDVNGRPIDTSLIKKMRAVHEDKLREMYGNKIATDWIIIKKRLDYNLTFFSKTEANALDYLKSLGHPDFLNCQGTIVLMKVLDEIESVFEANAADTGDGEEVALQKDNHHEWMPTWKKIIHYLNKIETDRPDLKSCLTGIIITIRSLLNIFQDHVITNADVPYLLPERFCNKHMTKFFAKLRPPADRLPTAFEVQRYFGLCCAIKLSSFKSL